MAEKRVCDLDLIMKRKRIDSKDLANHLDISKDSVRKYRSGTRVPSIWTCIKISRFLGIDIENIWRIL